MVSVKYANGNDINVSNHIGVINPIRYRGYYYDTETGFYYLKSRYYDPAICRWISAEPNVYVGRFDYSEGIAGYNVFAYCANNPINYSDPNGEYILTAIIVGVVAGAVIGGTIGGVTSYESAKSSGVEGTDLFLETVAGVGKGAAIGSVAGGLIGATGGVIATYGISATASTALITATSSTEVAVLQSKKSILDGDNWWQAADDCVDSIFTMLSKLQDHC